MQRRGAKGCLMVFDPAEEGVGTKGRRSIRFREHVARLCRADFRSLSERGAEVKWRALVGGSPAGETKG